MKNIAITLFIFSSLPLLGQGGFLYATYNGLDWGGWIGYESDRLGVVSVHYDTGRGYLTPMAGMRFGKIYGGSFHAGIGFRPQSWEYRGGVFYGDNSPRALVAGIFHWKLLRGGVMYEVFQGRINGVFGIKVNIP